MKQVRKKKNILLCFLLLSLIFCSCSSDDNKEVATPYDASKPVTITDFTPKNGGGQMQMIIYGSNFLSP